ncbi:uncharacterized protein LOC134232880 isoform X1 [Saccostrea cucullata]|uniref:uncharacterized protein LOC134232880 isoform X1 n=1 Tax=Saccostrea cuccullata TaxID=36930 RepID=UPI002ED53D09
MKAVIYLETSCLLWIIWNGFGEADHLKKPGTCPAVSPSLTGSCNYFCTGDYDCEGEEKCCDNDCYSYSCQKPVVNEALTKGAECPQVSYRTDSFGFKWPMTSYIYCSTGCCGVRDNHYCCETKHHIGLYVGIAAATVVLVVLIVSVSCCCIHKYNKKNVIVGISPESHNQMLAAQRTQYQWPSAPPLYEQAISTGNQALTPNVSFSRTSGVLFDSKKQ